MAGAVKRSFAAVMHDLKIQNGALKSAESATVRTTITKSVSNNFIHTIFSNINLAIRDGKLFLKEVPFDDFFSLFRRGLAKEALALISAGASLPADAVRFMVREASQLPTFLLEKGAVISRQLPELKNLRSVDELEAVAKTSPKVEKMLNFLRKRIVSRKFVGFSVTLAVVGGTTAALAARYREELTGCFRYETVNGLTSACKVTRLTCKAKDHKLTDEMKYCSDNQLEKSQQSLNCIDADTKDICRGCDSDQTDPANVNYISERDKIGYNVVYRCRNPDFAEALGDMAQDYITTVADSVADTVKTGGNLIKYIIYAVIGAIGVGLLFYIVRKFSPSSSSQRPVYVDSERQPLL